MQAYSIGVDIGGTFTKIGIVDKQGNILSKTQIQTASHQNVEDFLMEIRDQIKKLFDQLKLKIQQIEGIGVGAPNGNGLDGCIHYAPNLPWKGKISLVEMLEKVIGLPVFLNNDANAAAIAEKIFGQARESNDFAVITLGTGLGSGIFSQGKLLYGATGMAGELGHTILFPNGRLCSCGNKGCVETYVSVRGFLQNYRELVGKNTEVTPEKILALAMQGNALAQQAIELTAYYLGIALANLVNLFSLDLILLTGGLMTQGEMFLPHIQQSFKDHVLPVFENVTIKLSQFNTSEAGLLGASALVYYHN